MTMLAITLFLAAVVLAVPFGEANAAALDDSDGLTIEVSVEIDGSYGVVLVRPFSSYEELAPTALRNLGDGTWGGLVVLPTAEDWFVVFDAIEPDGTSTRSESTTLTAMGVDPVVVQGEPEAPVSRSIDTSTWWLIAGAVLALAALGALAWWTFAPGDASGTDDESGTVAEDTGEDDSPT
jgi:hypothetical protein